jgi:hypothetical protein
MSVFSGQSVQFSIYQVSDLQTHTMRAVKLANTITRIRSKNP